MANTTPKQSFISENTTRDEFEKLIGSKTMLKARDAALLQFVHEQPREQEVNKAWDAHSQLIGARRMLDIFFNLHLVELPPPKAERLPSLRIPS